MDVQVLKSLILDQRSRFFSDTGLVPRDCMPVIFSRIAKNEIEVITGVRRSGKSSLMKLIAGDLIRREQATADQILYVNFDDERFIGFDVSHFNLLYESYLELFNPDNRMYFFLDEIQQIDGWERWINRMAEQNNVKLFITGSNTSLLEPEIGRYLTGRHRQTVNWPFSFREYLLLNNADVRKNELFQTEKKAKIKRHLNRFIQNGGFPEVVKQNDTDLLEQYYRDILYRDIVARRGIRNIRELKELSLFLISNPGTVNSYENMQNMTGLKSLGSAKNFSEILEEVFLVFRLPLFDYSVKKQIYNPGKFYLVDTGLFYAVGFSFSENMGHLIENAVFIELKRRQQDVYYWKSDKGREIDFVCRKGSKITTAIQVCLKMHDKKTRDREFRALTDAAADLHPENLLVITLDEDGHEKIEECDIQIVPLWKWLLMDKAQT